MDGLSVYQDLLRLLGDLDPERDHYSTRRRTVCPYIPQGEYLELTGRDRPRLSGSGKSLSNRHTGWRLVVHERLLCVYHAGSHPPVRRQKRRG